MVPENAACTKVYTVYNTSVIAKNPPLSFLIQKSFRIIIQYTVITAGKSLLGLLGSVETVSYVEVFGSSSLDSLVVITFVKLLFCV